MKDDSGCWFVRRGRPVAALASAVFALAAASRSGFATSAGEPFNNTWPGNYPEKVILQHTSGSGWSSYGWDISPAGDVDFFVIACSQATVSDSPRFVDRVLINLGSGAGDLDIDVWVWDPSQGQRWLGGSYGTGAQEQVVVPGNFTSVYLKVKGYSGATGQYSTQFHCR